MTQFGHAGHGRVLVTAVEQGVGGGLKDVGGAVGIGEALAQIIALCSVASAYFQAAAPRAGIIPWRLDLDRIEEDSFCAWPNPWARRAH